MMVNGDHLWIRDFESTNGTFVNQKAIKQAELLETGDTISIGKFKFCLKSVNSTPLEIQQMDVLLESLGRIHDMAPLNKIVLEINEKATTDTNEMSRLRNALGKLNIDLAFDDFGVGQTRLMELAKAPPDFLKFDKSLIRQIHLAPKRLHQMVSTFVKAAQDLALPLSQRELNALMRLKHANGSVLISLRAFSMAGPCPSTKSTKHI